ncbi:unnamed protein product [Durusdinium trenchii]|uniref:Uncharacterized protein n=1 Tax=Durusdinium trenchii TaxID=1381693 RepID=A0ABP0NKB8_9DINO
MALTARGPGRGQDPTQTRHKTQSASPRPQRFCAVDAVRVAKEELAASGPIVKAGRLRLARVLDESTSDVGPILHEGFYKLAAAVTRPEPTLRQKATALQKSLEMQLKCLRQKGEVDQMHWTEQKAPLQLPALEGAERVETFLTQEEASVDPVGGAELQLVSASAPLRAPSMAAAAERAREEMELCIDTLLSYARETSTESRERRALLDSTSEAAAASIRKFLDLIERQAEAVREAGEKMEELQGRIRELEEDNDGLRRVVQQALKDEGEMQRQKEEKETEVEEGQQKLSEAESRSEELSTQLQKALETLRMQEEKRREAKEKLRDGGNSPMMHFSTFVLGPDQVPSGNAHISGEVKERMEPTRSESGLARRTERKNDAAQSNPTSKRDSLTSQGDVRVHAAPAFARSRSDSHSVVVSRSMTPEQLLESSSEVEEETAAPVMVKKISSGPRRKSFEEEDSESDGAVEPPRPSPLAASFPALVPFLDFQKDAESEKIKAQTVAQNHEHLEKHMVLLQEEKNKHMEQNKLLQKAVDSTLERLLVWVQAGFDSLRDFGPESVQQDAVALAAIRDMLAWLSSCLNRNVPSWFPAFAAPLPRAAWIEPSAHLQQVLSSHEERVRQALELAEKQSSSAGTRRSEVDELQKALQEQTQRAEDLQQRLEEVAAEQEELAFRRVVEESTPPVLGAEQDSAMLDVAGAPARAESAVTLSTASAVPVGDSQAIHGRADGCVRRRAAGPPDRWMEGMEVLR